jgi:hypothetical protein
MTAMNEMALETERTISDTAEILAKSRTSLSAVKTKNM